MLENIGHCKKLSHSHQSNISSIISVINQFLKILCHVHWVAVTRILCKKYSKKRSYFVIKSSSNCGHSNTDWVSSTTNE